MRVTPPGPLLTQEGGLIIKFDHLLATQKFAHKFARTLKPGARLSLEGPIGSGKTSFVQALYDGLMPDSDYLVTSPTFTLLQEYPLKTGALIHLDLYRMNSYADYVASDLQASFGDGDIVCIEWGNRFPELEALWTHRLKFEIIKANQRELNLIR